MLTKAHKLIENHYKKLEVQIDEVESGEQFLTEGKNKNCHFRFWS